MADLLVRRAGRVFGIDVEAPAAVVIAEGRVAAVAPEARLRRTLDDLAWSPDNPELDASGRAIVPGFVDAHTHLVFAGDRAAEFEARLAGRAYETGGIQTTVAATRAASFDDLVAGVVGRAARCLAGGTTTIEVKSGYGLSTEAERRCLAAVREAGRRSPAELVPTFLGAHLAPDPGYIDLVVDEMLPACAGLAVSCDAFCDTGALTVEQSRRVLEAGTSFGLVPRLHAEELAHTGGAALAAELHCASADHLVHVTDADAAALAAAGVVAVLLPATSFCLRSSYAPARALMDAGVTVALGTDCNPGTSYTTSMPFVIALACSAYGMGIDEAVRAATAGGAAALRRTDIGHLHAGARGDLVVIDGDHWVDIAYHPGMDVIAHVVKDGAVIA
jgi:imidazolonepropionase